MKPAATWLHLQLSADHLETTELARPHHTVGTIPGRMRSTMRPVFCLIYPRTPQTRRQSTETPTSTFAIPSPGTSITRSQRLVDPKRLSHGWELNSGFSFHGGTPYTVVASTNVSGNGDNADRAVQVIANPNAGVSHAIVGGSVQWFNPTHLSIPQPEPTPRHAVDRTITPAMNRSISRSSRQHRSSKAHTLSALSSR
jgi:hypothetical protein